MSEELKPEPEFNDRIEFTDIPDERYFTDGRHGLQRVGNQIRCIDVLSLSTERANGIPGRLYPPEPGLYRYIGSSADYRDIKNGKSMKLWKRRGAA